MNCQMFLSAGISILQNPDIVNVGVILNLIAKMPSFILLDEVSIFFGS